ncbi:hypothetical protein, partial [Pseudomonas poae]|uniref:hypothetical protein n=1 Tax=Pseudomonas poae TaxID=200451 RepID=UPI001F27AEA5
AACLLTFSGVFEIGKAHLAHGRLGSGGQAHFITFADLFGESLTLHVPTQAQLPLAFAGPLPV